jgi:hypothetical protein
MNYRLLATDWQNRITGTAVEKKMRRNETKNLFLKIKNLAAVPLTGEVVKR